MTPATALSHRVLLTLIVLSTLRQTVGCTHREFLSSNEGTVDSPTDGFSTQYSNNVDHCWVIRASDAVVIKFTRFDLESCCDKVHLYNNTEYPSDSSEVFELSESNVTSSEFWMTGTTLVRFTTDPGVTRTGFSFRYQLRPTFSLPTLGTHPSVELIRSTRGTRKSHPNFGLVSRYADFYRLYSNIYSMYSNNLLQAWSIYAESNQLVSIQIAAFNTESGCDWLKVYPGFMPTIGSAELWRISGSHSNISNQFTGSVTIVFNTDNTDSGTGFEFLFTIAEGSSNTRDPESVRIELIKPELWSLTGVIQFRAVSHAACPSVRHRCELRLASGSSVPAAQINMVSGFSLCDMAVGSYSRNLSGTNFQKTSLQCQGSVETNFVLVQPPSIDANSQIACRLLNGSFVEHPLLDRVVSTSRRYRQYTSTEMYERITTPSSDSMLASLWERPLVRAGFALLVLGGIACALFVRAAWARTSGRTGIRQGREEDAVHLVSVQ